MAMHRFITPVLSLALLSVVACGSDADSDVMRTADSDDDSEDAGTMDPVGDDDDVDGGSSGADDDPSDDDPSDDDDDPSVDAGPEMPDPLDPPDPVLPGVDPETPISDLDPDEFGKICDTFIDSADALLVSAANVCGFSALNDALEEDPETDEEFQTLCADNRSACESELESSTTILNALECTQSDECTATVEEFDACNLELATFDAVIFKPLGSIEVGPCDQLSRRAAEAIRLQGAAAILLASVAAGEDPLENESAACALVTEKCPGLDLPTLDL